MSFKPSYLLRSCQTLEFIWNGDKYRALIELGNSTEYFHLHQVQSLPNGMAITQNHPYKRLLEKEVKRLLEESYANFFKKHHSI